MVALRSQVTVSIAGFNLTPSQWLLLRYGKWLFTTLRMQSADGTPIGRLGVLNLTFYCATAAQVGFFIVNVVFEGGNTWLGKLQSNVLVLAGFVVIWTFGSDGLRQTVRRAQSGSWVLRVLLAAARHSETSAGRPELPVQHFQRVLRKLQSELAWLPAYDRRDVMTVKAVINAYSKLHVAEIQPAFKRSRSPLLFGVFRRRPTTPTTDNATGNEEWTVDGEAPAGDNGSPDEENGQLAEMSAQDAIIVATANPVRASAGWSGQREVIQPSMVEIVDAAIASSPSAVPPGEPRKLTRTRERLSILSDAVKGRLGSLRRYVSKGAAEAAAAAAAAAAYQKVMAGDEDSDALILSIFIAAQLQRGPAYDKPKASQSPCTWLAQVGIGADTNKPKASSRRFTEGIRRTSDCRSSNAGVADAVGNLTMSPGRESSESTHLHSLWFTDSAEAPSVVSASPSPAAIATRLSRATVGRAPAALLSGAPATSSPLPAASKALSTDASAPSIARIKRPNSLPMLGDDYHSIALARTIARSLTVSLTDVWESGTKISADSSAVATYFRELSPSSLARKRLQRRQRIINRVLKRGMIDGQDDLTFSELSVVGWRLVRGVNCLACVPGGAFFVDAPIRVLPKEGMTDPIVHWAWDLRFRRKPVGFRVHLRRQIFATLFLGQIVLTACLRAVVIALKMEFPRSSNIWQFYRLVRIWVTPIGQSVAVLYLLWTVQLMQALGFLWNGYFPMPLRYGGKLEYALLFAALGYLLASQAQIFTLETEDENLPALINGMLIALSFFFEVVLATTSAVVSAVRYRDVRLLLEYTSKHVEIAASFVV